MRLSSSPRRVNVARRSKEDSSGERTVAFPPFSASFLGGVQVRNGSKGGCQPLAVVRRPLLSPEAFFPLLFAAGGITGVPSLPPTLLQVK